MLKAPPRLLLGLGFLFWGAMGDYPFIGLVGAVAFEARHWTPLRWLRARVAALYCGFDYRCGALFLV